MMKLFFEVVEDIDPSTVTEQLSQKLNELQVPHKIFVNGRRAFEVFPTENQDDDATIEEAVWELEENGQVEPGWSWM